MMSGLRQGLCWRPHSTLTCVDREVLQGHRAGHIANVGQHVLRDARGRARHALGLPIHVEEAWEGQGLFTFG